MIIQDKPTIITIKQGYEINNIEISLNQENKQWNAIVGYLIKDEKDNVISNGVLTYYEEEFNKFFQEWTTGAYLYKELISKNNLDIKIDEQKIEETFVNQVENI